MHDSCLGSSMATSHIQGALALSTGAGAWSYGLIVILAAAIIIGVVVAVKAVAEGRSVEVYRWGLKIGPRAEPQGTLLVQETRLFEAPRPDVNPKLTAWRPYAVGVNHERLLAVDEVIKSVTDTLLSDSGSWAVTLSGEGGRGKTAVAYEAVRELSRHSAFTRIVWAAAKTAAPAGGGGNAAANTVYWADVVRVIAAQLECKLRPSEALWESDLRNFIKQLPSGERILIVVDNLEGIQDVEKVLDHVRELSLAPPHRLIATTRWRLSRNSHDVKDVEILPLTRSDSLSLVRLIGVDSTDIRTASDRYLTPIYEITEGNPYLIKLIVSRYLESGLSLERVISGLASQRTREGREALSYLFEQSLEELAARSDRRSAQMLIASFCMYQRGEALTFDQLCQHSGISDEVALQNLIEVACRLTLVRPSDRNRRYSIHSLLYEFTCAS